MKKTITELQEELAYQREASERRIGEIKHQLLDAANWPGNRIDIDVMQALELVLHQRRELIAKCERLELEKHMLWLTTPQAKEAAF